MAGLSAGTNADAPWFLRLEAKRVLDASFGFISTPGGFAFQITGTDFQQTTDTPNARADSIALWGNLTGGGGVATNFFVEWVDNGGTWHSLSGSVAAGDIADEAQDRGLQPGDFVGFEIKALGGNDLVHANGAPLGATTASTDPGVTMIGIHPGAANAKQVIFAPMTGQRMTVDGNGGSDKVFGSPEDDIIRGGAGNDEIHGDAGNDTIMAGPDNDVIFGGSGADKLDGDDGRDLIMGGDGDDVISGGAGDDGWRNAANAEDLTFVMPEGSLERLGIPAGTVVKFGLYGDAGNYLAVALQRKGGGDTIDGGSGADDLTGDEGADKLLGGDGDDSLMGDNHDKDPEGGAGTDAWQAGITTTDDVKMISNSLEKVDTTGADANEPTVKLTYAPGSALAFVLINPGVGGPFGATGVTAFAFDDQIDLSGWVGNGTSGVQIITGGGHDFLAGSDVGGDALQAGDGDDTAVGLGNRDYIQGGQGSDLISGGGGGDELDGGFEPPDDDRFHRDTVTYNEVKLLDVKTFPGSPAGVIVSLQGGFGAGGDASGDVLRGFENAIGSEFNDVLFGDTGNNMLDGRGGDDQLYGFTGNDELRGGDGNDILRGSVSTVAPVQGPNEIPDPGADVLFGGKGNDQLFGESGPDKLLGGPDDDLIDGGTEVDDLSGGSGKDVLVSESSLGSLLDRYIFGNEGADIFQILGVETAGQQFLIMQELAERETLGSSDFEANEDDLELIPTGAIVNNPPVFTSAPVTTATVSQLYTYDANATDPDVGDVLTYSLDQSPAGMTINPLTGLIQWTPQGSDVGSHAVTVRAADNRGQFALQPYLLTVGV